jgi:hypothetical protein
LLSRTGDTIKLLAVLRTDELLTATCDAPEAYPALTPECEPFHMFEREMAEQYGIRPEGHPWLKMVRYHANYRGGKMSSATTTARTSRQIRLLFGCRG